MCVRVSDQVRARQARGPRRVFGSGARQAVFGSGRSAWGRARPEQWGARQRNARDTRNHNGAYGREAGRGAEEGCRLSGTDRSLVAALHCRLSRAATWRAKLGCPEVDSHFSSHYTPVARPAEACVQLPPNPSHFCPQAEHGPDSQVVLLALPGVDLDAVQMEVSRQCDALPRSDTARKALAHSCVVTVRGLVSGEGGAGRRAGVKRVGVAVAACGAAGQGVCGATRG